MFIILSLHFHINVRNPHNAGGKKLEGNAQVYWIVNDVEFIMLRMVYTYTKRGLGGI